MTFIDLADPDAPAHFVRDLNMPHDGWTFTGPAPALNVFYLAGARTKLRVEFTLWETAFRQTGPVELTFQVNGFELGKVRYSAPGPKVFQELVPEEDLTPGQESTVSISIDKPWIAPDGKKFGFILQRAGFVR